MHCNCFLAKPIRREELQHKLRRLGLRRNVDTSTWELGEPHPRRR